MVKSATSRVSNHEAIGLSSLETWPSAAPLGDERNCARPGIRPVRLMFFRNPPPVVSQNPRPLYAGMSAHDLPPNKKTTGENAIMTNPIHSDDGLEATSGLVDRRGMSRGAAAIAATAL